MDINRMIINAMSDKKSQLEQIGINLPRNTINNKFWLSINRFRPLINYKIKQMQTKYKTCRTIPKGFQRGFHEGVWGWARQWG